MNMKTMIQKYILKDDYADYDNGHLFFQNKYWTILFFITIKNRGILYSH